MPTATTTTEDSCLKLAQNHPHDFTMSPNQIGYFLNRARDGKFRACPPGEFCIATAAGLQVACVRLLRDRRNIHGNVSAGGRELLAQFLREPQQPPLLI